MHINEHAWLQKDADKAIIFPNTEWAQGGGYGLIGQWGNKQEKLIVGLMSGTSLDGIDAAVVKMSGFGTNARVELIAFHSTPYDSALREKLKDLCSTDQSDVASICAMNAHLGRKFAETAYDAVREAGVRMQDIDLIGSHGQTIWHIPLQEPQTPFHEASTLQIGDISVIAKLTGKPVVGDFRPADIAVGGQGAPLTPYADFILFRHPAKSRIVQNIGGIANCAAIPAGAQPKEVVAFDTGPGNMLIDQAMIYLTGGRHTYDPNGEWGEQGNVHAGLLEELLAHPYYSQKPVKTTGREMFGKAYALEWTIKAQHQLGLWPSDIVATLTAVTAHSIARSYRHFLFPSHRYEEVIVTGGGAHNRTLMRMLAELLPEQAVTGAESFGVSGDAKEAIAFAVMANDFMHGMPNHLPSATGADRPTVLGKLALP